MSVPSIVILWLNAPHARRSHHLTHKCTVNTTRYRKNTSFSYVNVTKKKKNRFDWVSASEEGGANSFGTHSNGQTVNNRTLLDRYRRDFCLGLRWIAHAVRCRIGHQSHLRNIRVLLQFQADPSDGTR